MDPALPALAGRIVLLGAERVTVKIMGTGASSLAATFLFFFLGGLCLLPFTILESAPWGVLLPRALASGSFYSVAFILYVRSLSTGEASLVGPLYNFNVFFLALIAALFLGEPLGVLKIVGLCLMVFGASYLQPRHSFIASMRAVIQSRPCQMMMAGSLLIAVGRVIDKSGMQYAPPITYCTVLYFVISAYLMVLISVKGRAGAVLRLMGERPAAAVLSGAINGFSYLLLLVAMKDIDVSIAEPVSMLGILVTLLLSKLVLREEIGARWAAAGLMLAGVFLLCSI